MLGWCAGLPKLSGFVFHQASLSRPRCCDNDKEPAAATAVDGKTYFRDGGRLWRWQRRASVPTATVGNRGACGSGRSGWWLLNNGCAGPQPSRTTCEFCPCTCAHGDRYSTMSTADLASWMGARCVYSHLSCGVVDFQPLNRGDGGRPCQRRRWVPTLGDGGGYSLLRRWTGGEG